MCKKKMISMVKLFSLRVVTTSYSLNYSPEVGVHNRIEISNKHSSKQEFNVNRVLLPFLVILHHWRWPCNLHNPKCHLSPGYPCMKQCHCSHKGMDIGISYLVVHFHVCKKFFQVLSPMSSVHHLVVPLENLLLLHLSCWNMLECWLGYGLYQSWRIGIGILVCQEFVVYCEV